MRDSVYVVIDPDSELLEFSSVEEIDRTLGRLTKIRGRIADCLEEADNLIGSIKAARSILQALHGVNR